MIWADKTALALAGTLLAITAFALVAVGVLAGEIGVRHVVASEGLQAAGLEAIAVASLWLLLRFADLLAKRISLHTQGFSEPAVPIVP